MPPKVFISYSTDDTAAVDEIRDSLEDAGISCWMAPRDIVPGSDYGSQIVEAIEACSALILILSESSNHSIYVRNEVERAVAKRKVLIPFRIHNLQPSRGLEFFISNAQWIDAWQPPLAAKLGILATTIWNHLVPLPVTVSPDSGVTLSPPHPAIPSPQRYNLPTPTTPFIGREMELAAIDALIADPAVRLITIIGSGGMGKTRLALEAGRRQISQVERFADGVYYVSLAPLRAAEHIVPAVAEGVGFQLKTGEQTRGPEQQVCDYLESKALLLILDNYEHLLDGAGVVTRLLQASPRLQVLVTSRERLHLQGEVIYPIQGLTFPDREAPDSTSEYTAVQLFVQSARRVLPDYELRTEDVASLNRISRLVGGMPLALELAAGWVELLPLADIAEEIQRSLDFLETENRDVPERQRSMRAAFDYSWQRLSQTEQAALAQLSVFRGGFDRNAAQQVAGASVRDLAALVAKSLMQVGADRRRYDIHEVIRQYSAQALALTSSADREVRDRHSAYYAERLQQREPDLMGADQMAALAEIEIEHENIRAGWDWAIQRGLIESLERAMESLCLFYEARGRYQEGMEACLACSGAKTVYTEPLVHVRSLIWLAAFAGVLGQHDDAHAYLQQAVTVIESDAVAKQESDRARAAVLMVMSGLAYGEGRAQQAREFAEQSLALFAALNRPWYVAKVGLQMSKAITYFSISGDVRVRQQQLTEASEIAHRSLDIYRTLNDRAGIAESVCALGWTMHLLGTQAVALSFLQEGIAIYDEIGTHRGRSTAHFYLAIIYSALGDYENARRHAEVAVRLARELGDPEQLGFALFELGRTAIIDHSPAEADRALQESVTVHRKSGNRGLMAIGLAYLAYADYSQGRRLEMHRHLLEALQIGHDTQFHLAYVVSLALVALLLMERGEIERSVELYTQALAHLTNGYRHSWFEDMAGRHITAAAADLAPQVVAAAQERGRQRNLWEIATGLLQEIKGWT